jgi:hypothetical protein
MKSKTKNKTAAHADVPLVLAYFVQRQSDLKFLASIYAIHGRNGHVITVAEEDRWSDDIKDAIRISAEWIELFELFNDRTLILSPIRTRK